MFRPLLLAAAGLVLLAPVACAKTVVVTQAQNGRAVTLVSGDTLVVRLTSQTGLGGAAWHVVYNSEGMLRLSGDPHYSIPAHPRSILVVGDGPMTQEFQFTVPPSKGGFVKGAWLHFLSLSDFEPGVKGAKVWAVRYTVKATK